MYLCSRMKQLSYLNKYFWKYRWRLTLGIVFIFISNYFAVLAPQVTGYIIDKVQAFLTGTAKENIVQQNDWLVTRTIQWIETLSFSFTGIVALFGIILLIFAVLRGFFMFLMRQTIIVMSRHIEFDQKNEVFQHYLQLDTNFYKTNETGDLMNRISEDVGLVRMYLGPGIMYIINLIIAFTLIVTQMIRISPSLTLYVLIPLPIMSILIYRVSSRMNAMSALVQKEQSLL